MLQQPDPLRLQYRPSYPIVFIKTYLEEKEHKILLQKFSVQKWLMFWHFYFLWYRVWRKKKFKLLIHTNKHLKRSIQTFDSQYETLWLTCQTNKNSPNTWNPYKRSILEIIFGRSLYGGLVLESPLMGRHVSSFSRIE